MAALSRSKTRPVAAMAVLSSRSGQMPGFGLRIADFVLPRVRSLSAAKPGHFLSRAGKAIGRFIKAGQPHWPFYQRRCSNSGRFMKARPVAAMAGVSPRSGHMARSLDLDCGWPISYCPVQAVYRRPSRAIFRKSWQSERTASKASYKASYAASYSLKLLRKLFFNRRTTLLLKLLIKLLLKLRIRSLDKVHKEDAATR